MSTEITINCDGYCNQSFGFDDADDAETLLSEKCWHEDPETVDVHYCQQCWIEVKKENPSWED